MSVGLTRCMEVDVTELMVNLLVKVTRHLEPVWDTEAYLDVPLEFLSRSSGNDAICRVAATI